MLTVLYTLKVYFSFFSFFLMTQVLLHLYTAEQGRNNVECECFLLCEQLQCSSELFVQPQKF